ncbi:MAG TPA: N-acetylglucosamine-6-phosphate deacetylase [Thermodesulfobacteriota bacterium]|nr:N-acetylglucosamine-6-phosphate deacetylase [Thermodesulfobacteriota bacterium]
MIIRGKIPGTESTVDIVVEHGKVVQVDPYHKGSRYDFGGTDLYACSGFFDPQVNGLAGVDFNSPCLTPEALHRAALSLASTGVTRFLPTLITSSHERMVCQMKILAEALRKDPLLQDMCLGIHLEGPYISPDEGPRGAHPPEFIRPPRWEELEKFQEACEGRIKCVTLAPELEGAIPFIEKAVSHGIVIGIGHTRATPKDLEQAIEAGARLSCHLGNAPAALLPRYRALIEKQLAADQLMASIIVDGIHLSPDVVKNYVRAKGINRIVLTTDSMAGAGAPPGRYTLGDQEVEVTCDRAARLVTTSRLAGSTLTMDHAITNVIHFAGMDLASAIGMAAKNGQKLFPEVRGEMISGGAADLVLFEYQGDLVIRSVWIEGEKIF